MPSTPASTPDPVHFAGLLYRAHNPVWSRAPLSGEGAARFGGRFNRIGRPALYTSLAPETAVREANQVGTLQPVTLVAYQADIGPLLDGRDESALNPFGMTPADLSDPAWRDRMLAGKPVPTQDLAGRGCERPFRDHRPELCARCPGGGAQPRSVGLGWTAHARG